MAEGYTLSRTATAPHPARALLLGLALPAPRALLLTRPRPAITLPRPALALSRPAVANCGALACQYALPVRSAAH
jgi:hypothetical protein